MCQYQSTMDFKQTLIIKYRKCVHLYTYYIIGTLPDVKKSNGTTRVKQMLIKPRISF